MPTVTSDKPTGQIAYLVKTFPKVSETFILNEILGLEARNVSLQIFSLQTPTDPLVHERQQLVNATCFYPPVRLFGGEQLSGWRAHLRLLTRHPLRYLRALYHALSRKEGFEASEFIQAGWIGNRLLHSGVHHLHAHFATTPTAVTELLSLMTGIPYSFTAHAKDLFLSDRNVLNRKIHHAQFVLTCTEFNRDILQHISTNGTPIHRIYHGLDLHHIRTEFPPNPQPSLGPPLLLSVGRFREKKGFSTLLEACRLLHQEGQQFRCVIIGYGPLQLALERQIQESGLRSLVQLTGQKTQDDVIAMYRQATVFALPCQTASDGDRDGIPNVLIEAMAMELPVISTAISGIPELIDHGKNGLLVPESDPAALAQALRLLLEDAKLRLQLGAAARKKVLTHFSLAPNVNSLCTLFHQVLDKQSERSRTISTGQPTIIQTPTSSSLSTPHGTIGYVVKGYPRNSEAFITHEMAILESMSVPLHIFSVKQPPQETSHSIVNQITAPVTYLPSIPSLSESPFLRWLIISLPKFTNSHITLFRSKPLTYLSTLGEALCMTVRYRTARFGTLKKVFFKEFLQAGFIAAETLQQGAITHLHAHFCHGSTTIGMFASQLTGLPFSFTAHAKDIYVSKLNPGNLLTLKLQRAKFVVTCTESNRQHLQSLCEKETPIHTIYHGLNTTQFVSTSPRETDRPMILSIGRFVEKKGFPYLIQACAVLKNRGWTFHCRIIGEPDDHFTPTQHLIRDLDLTETVMLEPAMTQEALRDAYQQSSLFVLPCQIVQNGDRDGIPNVLAEAMATGLPVISTAISGIPELITNREDGLLVPQQDALALANAMEELLANPSLRATLGKAGREKILYMFDSQQNTLSLKHLFQGTEVTPHLRIPVSPLRKEKVRHV